MADTIDFVAEDEVQPEEIDFQEEVAPVVRIVPPGSLNPDELLPAVRKIGGALAVGEPGDTHPDIIKRDKIPATDIDQRGFAGPQGEFYDRESAAQGTQLPTAMEPGRLHSTDLIDAMSQIQPPAILEYPTPQPGATLAEVIRQPALRFAPPEYFQTPEQFGTQQAIKKEVSERPFAPIETAETLAGIAEPPASTGALSLLGLAGLPMPSEGAPVTPEERISMELAIPELTRAIGPDATATLTREAYNLAVGIPDFFTSLPGLASVVAGRIAPTATKGFFTADMLKTIGQQILDTYQNWGQMSFNDKLKAFLDIAATGVMTTGLAKHTGKELRTKLNKILAKKMPPAAQPGEAPPTAPVEVTAKPVEVATPATVEPAITEAKPEITNPQSIASNLGLRYRGTMRGIDQYVFDEPNVKTGAPSGITVSVPAGTPESGVATKLAARRAEYAEPVAEVAPKLPSANEVFKASDAEIRTVLGERGVQGSALTDKLASEMTEVQLKEAEPIIADYLKKQSDAKSLLEQNKISLQEYINTALEGKNKGKLFVDVFAALNRPLPELPKTVAPTTPIGLPEPASGTVRVFSGGRGSSWYTTNIKRAGDFAKRNAGVLNWVDVPKEVFDAASVAAKEAGSFTEGDALLPNEWVKKSANLRETLLKQAKEKIAPTVTSKPIIETLWTSSEPKSGEATYFSNLRTDAESYSMGRPIQQYEVKYNKPFDPDTSKDMGLVSMFDNLGGIYEAPRNPEFVQALKDKGYDAVIGGEKGFGPESKWVVIFDKTKSKSVPKPVEPTPVAPVPEPELVAMGGAVAGEKPAAAQIEQLTQAMRGVQESKAPLGQQIREAFNIGQRFATAKNAIGQAVSGLKTAGDLLINKWKGVEKIDDLLRAKGKLSQQIEARGWRLRQWEKAAQKAIPSARDQAAIAKWVDAGGDRATLEKGLAESPAKFKQAYADALALKGDKLTAAQNVQNYFESRLQEAIDAGVLDHGVENYIHRMYESKPDLLKRALAYTQTGLLKTSPSLAKKRVFQFDWEAEKEGYVPVQSFIKRITSYEASLSKAIAAREFIKKASELKAPDGRPIIDIKGVGIPVEDPAGVYREATLIKPKYNPTKNNEPLLPTGAPNPNYRGDYANRDYRALSRWKWVGSDAGGKPVFVQGDVAIHPDYVGRVDALLQPSQVRYGKYGKVLRPALGASSVMKQTMLDLSGFHYVQITVHGMEHRVFPWNIIKDIDLSNPNVDGLLRGGVSLGGDYGGAFREGLVGSSLTRLIPGLGNAIESYHQWLFQDYIPRIKMTMALHALERNRARFGDRMSEEEIFRKTANQANAAFGELNYIMLERSKTAQDISRLILLAPDFLEARARFAAQAFEKGGKRFGNEQRMALMFGALTMWITARIANKIVDGQYHNEPENLFNIVYDGHAYGLRTVQGDILHFLTKPIQFWTSRLNPVYGRTTLEALTGRDYFGRKRSFPEQAWDAVSTVIPISLRSNKERKLWESLLNGFGVTARRWSDVDDAFTLAKKWKETHGVTERGEFIYDPQKDVLRPLKLALNHGDEVGAAKEIKALIDSKAYTIKRLNSYFDRYANMPFAGSFANDKKFKATLTDDQKKTVEAARQHKIEIKKLYQKSRAQYLARPVQDVGTPEVKIDFVETK